MLTCSGDLIPVEIIVAFVCLVDEWLDWYLESLNAIVVSQVVLRVPRKLS
jgi:hypothetical protein